MKLKTMTSILFSRLRHNYRIKIVEDVPDEVCQGIFYVVGQPDAPQYGIMMCPCGCGSSVELNLNPASNPCWTLEFHPLGTISLAPSIWRKSSGCHSHFFLKKSQIAWCKR